MERIVFSDVRNHRLVYVGAPADEGYWDSHWAERLTASDIRKPDRFVLGVTKRFLAKGSTVVDVGCGAARTVYGLHCAGFDAYGVDYAPATVAAINELAPELQVTLGDARHLTFPDENFDGVWSLGVVEHFYGGFEPIAMETARVLKPGGYAFVTVPTMSPLRNLKARMNAYPTIDHQPERFYQFALPPEAVIDGFTAHGLELIKVNKRGGFKVLKDEVAFLRRPLQRLYDSKHSSLRSLRAALDKILAPLTCHTRLYIFRKL